jgi:hypothetical protein
VASGTCCAANATDRTTSKGCHVTVLCWVLSSQRLTWTRNSNLSGIYLNIRGAALSIEEFQYARYTLLSDRIVPGSRDFAVAQLEEIPGRHEGQRLCAGINTKLPYGSPSWLPGG